VAASTTRPEAMHVTDAGSRQTNRPAEAGRAGRQARQVLPWIEGALLVVFLVLPWLVDHYWVTFATRIAILGMLALSFDLVWGFAGILSFGQALFFGVAGYCVALAATRFGVTSAVLLLALAVAVGLVVALAMAGVVLFGKRAPSQVFVALGTLTGSYVVDRAVRGWELVGGQNGIPSIPPASLFGVELLEGRGFYFVSVALLLAVYLGLRWLVRSQFGLVQAGIRQNEDRVGFLGYPTQNYKGVVFCIAGAVAGLAGGLYVLHEGFAGPGQIGPVLSTQVVLYAMFGGVGTLAGAVIGTGLVEVVGYFASQYWQIGWPIILALLLLAVITFRPSGLIGFIVSQRERKGSFGTRARPRRRA
jgi:branched-chain amino acid transport system permease protein